MVANADVRKAQKAPISQYAKAIVINIISVYPFLAGVVAVSSLQPSDFVLCTYAEPCFDFRLFASGGVAATHGSFVEVKVTPSDSDRCESDEVRRAIQNPMPRSPSLMVSLVCVVLWGFFKVIHDCLVLCSLGQATTLTIGWLAGCFQSLAAAAGLLLAMTAVEAFVDKDTSCWYQLPHLKAVLICTSPGLLFWLSLKKMHNGMRAGVHGDYLYYTSYNVPYHLVKYSPGSRSDTLILPEVAGNTEVPAVEPPLPGQSYYAQRTCLRKCFACVAVSSVRVAMVVASIPMIPHLLGIIQAKAEDPFWQHPLSRNALVLARLSPCLLPFADATLRCITVAKSTIRTKVMWSSLIFSVLGFYLSFSLAPPIEFVIGNGSLEPATVSNCAKLGYCFAGSIFLLNIRWGMYEVLFPTEDLELITLVKSGRHLDLKFTKRRVGQQFFNPRDLVKFEHDRPDFAATYLKVEMQKAHEFLESTPSYSHEEDFQKWREYLLAHASTEVDGYRPLA